jgi:hypothetical protein
MPGASAVIIDVVSLVSNPEDGVIVWIVGATDIDTLVIGNRVETIELRTGTAN